MTENKTKQNKTIGAAMRVRDIREIYTSVWEFIYVRDSIDLNQFKHNDEKDKNY